MRESGMGYQILLGVMEIHPFGMRIIDEKTENKEFSVRH